MNSLEQLRLLAHYNQWMNKKVVDTAGKLTLSQLAADKGAFFGSLLGTLNHLVVADTIWLKRFATHPADFGALASFKGIEAPKTLADILYRDLESLTTRRQEIDNMIIQWCEEMRDEHLDHRLNYHNMKGEPFRRRFGSLVFHLFNHQTHHRGQATTLLSQAGLDVGVTDLLTLIPNEPEP